MRIILKVSSNNEYCNGGYEFAVVDLSPELAGLAMGPSRRREGDVGEHAGQASN
jgi:hypothetical protein